MTWVPRLALNRSSCDTPTCTVRLLRKPRGGSMQDSRKCSSPSLTRYSENEGLRISPRFSVNRCGGVDLNHRPLGYERPDFVKRKTTKARTVSKKYTKTRSGTLGHRKVCTRVYSFSTFGLIAWKGVNGPNMRANPLSDLHSEIVSCY